ncbi:MAG: polyprenyl synthetase family protein [Ignavibacteria bacterium]|jgi:geranylgeranyl diphosphate synthase type II|nr:polyprenyl synthetase family protein [Ignavibacteria bacterium]
MNLIQYSQKYNELKDLVERNIFASIPNHNTDLYDAYRYTMSGGGKRIRPLLTMITTGALGANPAEAVNAASAIEILHNFTLVHDDIMDNSNLRRGEPTTHKKWNEAIAILAGDMMTGWAFKLLAQSNTPQVGELTQILADALVYVCEGQELDVRFNRRSQVTVSEYIEMVRLKTSSLMRAAVKLGCVLSNASDEVVQKLDVFADNIGIGFQIQDDILDFTAKDEKFGKKIGQDLIEGKRSYPVVKALEVATQGEDITMLNRYLSLPSGLPEQFVPAYTALFQRLDVFEKAAKEVDRHFYLAKHSISTLPNNEYIEMLNMLLDSLNKRDY